MRQTISGYKLTHGNEKEEKQGRLNTQVCIIFTNWNQLAYINSAATTGVVNISPTY